MCAYHIATFLNGLSGTHCVLRLSHSEIIVLARPASSPSNTNSSATMCFVCGREATLALTLRLRVAGDIFDLTVSTAGQSFPPTLIPATTTDAAPDVSLGTKLRVALDSNLYSPVSLARP